MFKDLEWWLTHAEMCNFFFCCILLLQNGCPWGLKNLPKRKHVITPGRWLNLASFTMVCACFIMFYSSQLVKLDIRPSWTLHQFWHWCTSVYIDQCASVHIISYNGKLQRQCKGGQGRPSIELMAQLESRFSHMAMCKDVQRPRLDRLPQFSIQSTQAHGKPKRKISKAHEQISSDAYMRLAVPSTTCTTKSALHSPKHLTQKYKLQGLQSGLTMANASEIVRPFWHLWDCLMGCFI